MVWGFFAPIWIKSFLQEKQLKLLNSPGAIHLGPVKSPWATISINWLLVILQQHQDKTIPCQKSGSTWLMAHLNIGMNLGLAHLTLVCAPQA